MRWPALRVPARAHKVRLVVSFKLLLAAPLAAPGLDWALFWAGVALQAPELYEVARDARRVVSKAARRVRGR